MIFRRFRKIAKRNYWRRLVRPSVRPPVSLSIWNSAVTGRIFMKLYIWIIFANLLSNF